MNRLFRLGQVLRARKAQEDAARGAVNASRAEIRDAQQLVKRAPRIQAGMDALECAQFFGQCQFQHVLR